MREDTVSRAQAIRLVTFAGTLVFLVVLVRTAWINDDAYVSFRTIDNALHGFGLRWNVIQRVQTYTHPLWLLVMTAAAAVTGDVYYTAIAVTLILSLAAVALIGLKLSPSAPAAALGFSALVLSRSFVEYSTSGLENPLSHLLLVVYLAMWIATPKDRPTPRRVLALTLLASLCMVNRLDLGILIAPSLAVVVMAKGARRRWTMVLAGLLPLVAWELFAIIYYGFPVPNTAYAKLATDG